MKKQFNKLAGWLICIVFAVLLLYLKDNMGYIFSGVGTLFAILTPFIYAFGIAYIMNFPYRFFRKKVFGRIKATWFQKINKGVSLVVAYIIVFGLITFLISLLVPQLSKNLNNLVKNIPSYMNSFEIYTKDLGAWIKEHLGLDLSIFDNFNSFLISKAKEMASMDNVGKVFSAVSGTITVFYNWIMALVLSIYMLVNKEFLFNQFKRLGAAFLPTKWMPTIYEIINVSDEKCGKFLVGKILDSAIVGIMCFVCMVIVNLPYAPLISVIIAICNIIPFFGPFIGAIPSAFLLLLVSPWDSLIFIAMIFVIQQIDGNLINPKIVGSSVGLIGFWSLFSVMVAGALFGIPGMILGTPIFASIYTLIGRKTRKRIAMKGDNAERVISMNVINSNKLTNVKAKKSRKNSTIDDELKGKEELIEEIESNDETPDTEALTEEEKEKT
ncbi:MAG: AI-2E family transporter [Ruminococcus sp.]|nr:AI-2E family transporter [Ruminococcus sp.]